MNPRLALRTWCISFNCALLCAVFGRSSSLGGVLSMLCLLVSIPAGYYGFSNGIGKSGVQGESKSQASRISSAPSFGFQLPGDRRSLLLLPFVAFALGVLLGVLTKSHLLGILGFGFTAVITFWLLGLFGGARRARPVGAHLFFAALCGMGLEAGYVFIRLAHFFFT